jgi:heme/copper-type cytochrome/quinol oxidase subunit 2
VDLRGDWRCRFRGDVLLHLCPRKSKGHQASQFHESTKVEVAWTVVPFLILIAMAVPATSTLFEVYDNDEAELDILITGYQWKWKYEYLDEIGRAGRFSLISRRRKKRSITPTKRG